MGNHRPARLRKARALLDGAAAPPEGQMRLSSTTDSKDRLGLEGHIRAGSWLRWSTGGRGRRLHSWCGSFLRVRGAAARGSRVHHGAARFASARAWPGPGALRRTQPPRRPQQPHPARTAAAPMFHRCRPDGTDVPSVPPRPHGPAARRRSAHTPTAASMTSRWTGRMLAELASSCPPLPGSFPRHG
jgi:hypothetical protein